jgi:Flp pilus assembly protein TadB
MRPRIAYREHGIRRLTGDPPLQPGFTRQASQLIRHCNHVSAELERRRALCRTASPSRRSPRMPFKAAAGARRMLMAFVLMVVVLMVVVLMVVVLMVVVLMVVVLMVVVLMVVVAVVVVASMGMLVAIPMPLGTTMLIPMAVRHHKPSREQLSNNDRTSGQPATADERISHDLNAIRHSRQRQCQGRCP